MAIRVLIFIGMALCGGLGALSRFGMTALINRYRKTTIPIGTFFVNILASFLAGILVGLAVRNLAFQWPGFTHIHYILGSGFLGGFSTFSTASVESYEEFRKTKAGLISGIIYTIGMLVLSVCMCIVGYYIGMQM